MKAMHVFRIRQESLNYYDSERYYEGHDATIDDIENVLLDMGDDIVTGKESRRTSRKMSIESTTIGSRSSDRGVYPTTHQPPLRESSHESLRVMTNQPIAIHPRDVPRYGHSPPTSKSSSSTLRSLSVRIQDDLRLDEASHLDEGDYIAVQASGRLLYLDPGLNSQVVEGYINSNIKPTNASLNSEFPHNVISELYAAELGLVIEYSRRDDEDHTDNEAGDKDIETGIDFGNGDVYSVIGRTRFWWKNGQQVVT